MRRPGAKVDAMVCIRHLLSAAAVPALLASAAVSAALLARFLLIEPPQYAWAFQMAVPPAWCPVRAAAIMAVRAGAPGFLALLAGVFALWRGSRVAALIAVAAGAAGLGLYVPEPAAAGFLLGALALVREPACPAGRLGHSHTPAASSRQTPVHPSA